MWCEGIIEGAHMGTTTTRARLGDLARQVDCAHLVYLALILFAQNFLKYSEKIVLIFQSILRTFIFGSFFIAREIQKTDKTWHFILFN